MKRSRILLSITIIFFWASEYCHAPYFTPYLQTLGFTANIIGIMTGMYGFTQMLVRIPLGIVTDVTGCYKKTILMGTVFTTLSSFGLIFSTHFITIVICRILAGIAASSWLAFTVLYAAYYEAEKSVQTMTNVNAFNSAGKFLAFILGLATASLWGYRIPLVCSFLTGIVAIVCASRLEPVALKRESFQIRHVAAVFRHPAVLCASFFAIIMQLFLQGTVFSFTSAVARDLGASAFEIGLATVLFTLVQLLSANFIGRKLLKRISTCQAVILGCLIMTCCCLLVAFATDMLFIYTAQILGGAGNLMLSGVLMSLIIRYIPQENQSTAMGLFQALYGIGMTLGPVLTGNLAGRWGYSAAYLFIGGITLAAAALAPFTVGRLNKN
ncbi:MAG: MFS transporter [Enterocloster sp.]